MKSFGNSSSVFGARGVKAGLELAFAVLLLANAGLFGPAQAQFLDPGFNPGTGPNGEIYALKVDQAGRVVVAGAFTSCSGMPRTGIARYNPDGTLDSFAPVLTLPRKQGTPSVTQLVLEEDGSIIIAGGFAQVNGVARAGFARLTATGSLDTTYAPRPEVVSGVFRIARLAGGRLFVAESFPDPSNTHQFRYLMLLPDGTLDPSFVPGIASDYISSVALLPSGRVLIGGAFRSINGAPCYGFGRISADGTFDTSFNPPANLGAGDIALQSVSPDPNLPEELRFKLIVISGTNPLLRLGFNGELEFAYERGTCWQFFTLSADSDGSVLATGEALDAGGDCYGQALFRFLPDGLMDRSFWPVCATPPASMYGIHQGCIAVSAGKIFIGGNINSLNCQDCPRIVQLNSSPIPDEYVAFLLGSPVITKAKSGNGWIATLRIPVCTSAGLPVPGVAIRGNWTSYTASATLARSLAPVVKISDSAGECVFQQAFSRNEAAAQFNMTAVVPASGSGYYYNPLLDQLRPPFSCVNTSPRIYAP
jgi:uncharacterized delta-60 repeat protein